MKYLLVFSCLLLIVPVFQAQQTDDYREARPDLIPSLCGLQDSLGLTEVLAKLEAFDTTGVKKHLEGYYEDLGITYHGIYLHAGDTSLIRKAVVVYNKALYHDPKSHSALWNLIFAYHILGDCPNTLLSINRFKSRMKRKYWDLDELAPLIRACSPEN
jgi:hypothetical protein